MSEIRTGRLAGALYLALLPLGIFSFVYVPLVILRPGDPAATVSNLAASEVLFRAGIVSHLASQVLVVFVALAFYRLFVAVDRERAVRMVLLALLCVPISFAAEVWSLAAVRLAAGGGGAVGEDLAAEVMQLLASQRSGILLAQVFWGLWLFQLAGLVYRASFLPRLLATPVLIASLGYLADSLLYIVAPEAPQVAAFTALAELVLPIWLVVRGT